jgi:Tol biopolymer transport system component
MRGVVYTGKGTAPAGLDQLRAGMDYTYEHVSRSTNDKTTSGFYECGDYAIGGYQESEGRYVAFVSLTAGLEGSSGKYRQLFWRDRNTGITKLVSVSPAGEQGNGDCYAPSLSADGQSLVFESNASNLVAGDNNNAKDIFIWNAGTNSIQLVSKAPGGGFADAESFDASLSGNGQYVVFSSSAGNLCKVPKGQSISNVFVRDLAKGETEMVSVDPVLKTGGNGGKGSISFDGSRISFSSASPNLVKDDTNGLWDIFLWQRGVQEFRRVSLTHDGKERNQGQESASRFVGSALSGNGRYVAYATTATNVVPNDPNNFQDVFVVDLETGKVVIVSQTDDGQAANNDSPIEQAEKVAISYDGTWIAFPTKSTNLGAPEGNIILHNLVTGKKQVVSTVQGSYVGKPVISYSGSYVLFSKSTPLDNRFSSSGIFAHFTGNGPCREFLPR